MNGCSVLEVAAFSMAGAAEKSFSSYLGSLGFGVIGCGKGLRNCEILRWIVSQMKALGAHISLGESAHHDVDA